MIEIPWIAFDDDQHDDLFYLKDGVDFCNQRMYNPVTIEDLRNAV